MKLRTKYNRYHAIDRPLDMVTALTNLGWAKNEDDFLVCDDGADGAVQVAKWRPEQYIVEWRDGEDPTDPQHGLWRPHYTRSLGALVTRGRQDTGQFPLYQNELLSLPDVLGVLAAFWNGEDWPRHLYWRSLAPEMNKLIQFIDDKYGRMSLCE